MESNTVEVEEVNSRIVADLQECIVLDSKKKSATRVNLARGLQVKKKGSKKTTKVSLKGVKKSNRNTIVGALSNPNSEQLVTHVSNVGAVSSSISQAPTIPISDTFNHHLLWLCPLHQLQLFIFCPIPLHLKITVYHLFRTQPLVNLPPAATVRCLKLLSVQIKVQKDLLVYTGKKILLLRRDRKHRRFGNMVLKFSLKKKTLIRRTRLSSALIVLGLVRLLHRVLLSLCEIILKFANRSYKK